MHKHEFSFKLDSDMKYLVNNTFHSLVSMVTELPATAVVASGYSKSL